MIICLRCAKENQGHYKFCLGCGAELPRDHSGPKSFRAPTPPEGSAPAKRSVAPPSSSRAPARSSRPPVRSSRPPASSAPARASEPAKGTDAGCPNCGSGIPPNFKFCHICGHDLTTEDGAPEGSRVASAPPVELSAKKARASLVLIQPDGSEGQSFPLVGGRTEIGRDTGALFSGDAYLSPRHAEFRFEGDDLVVKDLDSLNGVYIRIEHDAPVELFDGSVFRIGQEIIRYEAPQAPETADDGTQLLGSRHQGYLGRLCLIIGRETSGNCFPISPDGIHLGRERGEVVFAEDGYVSGLHCRVHAEAGHIYLTDVGSSNGTFVRVIGESMVPASTYLLMGQQLFRADY